MTIATTTSRVVAQGNGATTSFSYSFLIPTADDAVLTFTDVDGVSTLLSTSQYSISGLGSPGGGTVTYPVSGPPMTIGQSLAVQRVLPFKQLTKLTNQGNYYPEVVEGALDSQEMQIQQLAETQGRTLQLPPSDPLTVSSVLPSVGLRALMLMSWDANGNPVAVAPAAQSATALAIVLASPGGAANLGYLPFGTSAVATTAQDKLRESLTLFDKLSAAQRADGTTGSPTIDVQALIQIGVNEAAAAGKPFLVNAGTWGVTFPGVNGLCIDVPSNSCIIFEPGASFKALAHNATIYQMLRVWDRDNVTIIRPRLDGNKAQNSATTGEFGMGIDIRGSTDVHVVDPHTVNCWGDGIYVGGSAANPVPKHVVVDNPYASGCRRQGLSIVSGIDIVFNNPVWENISGTAPSAGLDIEPDDNTSELQGIRINNPRTKNCAFGIDCYLGNFGGATPKVVDIEINDHTDDGSTVGCNINGANTAAGAHRIDGRITVTRPTWMNSGLAAFQSIDHDALGPAIDVIRPTVIDPNRSGGTAPRYNSPFVVLRDTPSALTYPIGNVRIVEPSITLRSGSIPNIFFGQDTVNGATGVSGVYFLDPIKLQGMTNDAQRGFFTGQGNISDKYGIWGWQSTGSVTLNGSYTSPILLPNSATTLTLADPSASGSIAGSPDIIIRQPTAAQGTVATATGGNFVGQVAGKQLRMTGAAGSYIRLKPLGANVYVATELVGAVTVV